MFKYSQQGGGTYVLSPTSAKYVIEILKLFNRKTNYLFATVSPLQFSKEHVEIALVFLKAGMGLNIGPMPIGGISAPVTIAGIVTLQIAEALASLFVVYALTGQFAAFTVAGHSMDLRSMLCSFGSPNQGLIGIATAQMARYYGYADAWTNSGLTDSLLPDFQGGMEKALTSVFSLLGGATNMGCQGIVGADQGISLEQLVLDNEWIAAFNHIAGGVEVSQETIGLDVIAQVGIGGSFVSQDHTVKHMRQSYWTSKLFNRQAWDGWVAQGSPSAYDKAHEFVEECLRMNFPGVPVLEPSLAARLDEVVQTAVDELTHENQMRI
jgi:trimethylamine--corrinoid protein Co-methyltransferase